MSCTWLITGSSRGIGLETVRQLLAVSSNVVFATCRNPDTASALHSLKRQGVGCLHIVKLDVDDEKSIKDAAGVVKGLLGDRGLDYLLNNAGIVIRKLENDGHDTAFTMSASGLIKTFHTNVVGPALAAQVFHPLVQMSNRKVIVNVSSGVGSFGKGIGSVVASYSISKAALNMLTYKQAKDRPEFIVFALNPGLVKTDSIDGVPSGALQAAKIAGVSPIEAWESVSNILQTVISATAGNSGKFLDYTGDELPW